jgi:hypothetical protein
VYLTTNHRVILGLLALFWLPLAAPAAGPVDGEATVNWWANDFDADVAGGDVDAGAFGGQVQLWWNEKWGLQGSLYRSDLADSGGGNDIDYLSLDLKQRLLSFTEHNYLAAGVGYERLDMSANGNTQGLRLLVEGRLGLAGAVYAYGHTAWIPVFEDTDSREDLDALEFEAGIGVSPLPFVTLSAGWRKFALDFTDSATDSGRSTSSSGPVFEAGVKW